MSHLLWMKCHSTSDFLKLRNGFVPHIQESWTSGITRKKWGWQVSLCHRRCRNESLTCQHYEPARSPERTSR